MGQVGPLLPITARYKKYLRSCVGPASMHFARNPPFLASLGQSRSRVLAVILIAVESPALGIGHRNIIRRQRTSFVGAASIYIFPTRRWNDA